MNDSVTRRMPRDPDDEGHSTLGGRYIAEHELASGGMATVYVGRDTVLDRPVAIKVLRPEPGRGPRDAFLREARTIASLRHAHIVDVYDAAVEGDVPYIVMEYVPGESLRDLIARDAPLEPARAALLIAAVAEALEYAHRRGVVHCDVKPANILLPAEDLPKIVDFGIAHVGNPTAAFRDEIVGTADYISPEQVEGVAPDGRADVYALAAVLYELLTGAPPFTGRNLAAVAAQRLSRPPEPPHRRNPTVPADLSAIVMRGLARDRELRYASAAEFAIALRRFAEGFTQTITRRVPADARTSSVTRSVARPIPEAGEMRTRTVTPPAPVPIPVQRRSARTPWGVLTALGALLAAGAAAFVLLASGIFGGDGGGTVVVPEVVNRRIDVAAEQIQGAELNVASPVQFVRGQQPLGTVIRQDPQPGAKLEPKSSVRLTVSLGPE